jgi:hypothetical protein
VAYFKVVSRNFTGGTEENNGKVSAYMVSRAEIQTLHLQNRIQNRCSFSQHDRQACIILLVRDGRACSTCGGNEKYIQNCGRKRLCKKSSLNVSDDGVTKCV